MFLVLAVPTYAYNQCSRTEKPSYTGCTVYLGWIPFDDYDCDCEADFFDNCKFAWNPGQEDSDGNGIGDACEPQENNPPSITSCSPLNSNIMVGDTARINYAVSDPDGDSVTVVVNWGDGISSTGGSSSATHIYTSTGTFTVTITATDSRSASTSRNCGAITVLPSANNPPVISSCTAPHSVIVNTVATISYSVSDPDGDSVTISVSWGDGSITTEDSSSASHVYSAAGTYSITITATDSKGASSSRTCGSIQVSDIKPCVPPTGLSPSSKVTISGDTGQVDLSWNGVADAVSYNVRLDDGTNERHDDPRFQTCQNSPHYYCENGITGTRITNVPVKAGRTYAFWVDPVYSPARNYCHGNTQFSVEKSPPSNNPPVISSCTAPHSVIVNTVATINYVVSDPDGDSVTVVVNWGDGTSSTGGSSSATHIYTSTGTFTVTITATDSRGLSTSRNCGAITVLPSANNPPVISSCTAPHSVIVNTVATINYAVSDPDGDSVTVVVNWGDGTSSTGGSSSATHIYTSTGTFTVTITATDSRGASTTSSCVTITVNPAPGNNPPEISSCSRSSSSIKPGDSLTINYAISDPENDAFTVKVNWGDSSITTGGSSSASHTYSSTGTFSISVNATDSKGASSTRSCGSVTVSTTPPPPTRAAKLKITNVDVKVDGKSSKNLDDGDTISKEAKPASEVEFKVEVSNLFTRTDDLDIEDITVKVTIEGIDDDDLDEESNEFDLRPDDDKTVTLRFNLPLNVDEGDFTVNIEAEGEDENGTEHRDEIDLDLEVEKDKHDLRFLRFNLNKQKVNCNEPFLVSYEIINLGQEDEEKAFVEIKNDVLGINIVDKDLSIDSGTEDNTFSKTHTLKVANDVEDGVYQIVGKAYSDDDGLEETKTLDLTLENCGKAKKKLTNLTSTASQFTTKIIREETIEIPILKFLFRGNKSLLILVFSTFILSIFFLIAAMIVMVRMEED